MKKLQERARHKDICFLPLKDVVANVDYIISTVTTRVAEEAARSCAGHLKPGQTFLDLNAAAEFFKAAGR